MSRTQSYGRIIKSTGIFGGVQIITALVGIMKTKIVAVLLGAEGVGLYGLLQSTISMISSLSNVGLSNSAVREIAQYDQKDDRKSIGSTIVVIKKWAMITGISGLILTIVFSPVLSELVFANKSYTFSFIWLSFSILFDQLSASNIVILQGLRKLNYLAKANIIGSLAGLLISVPCFYYYGEKGIVPALLLASFTLLIRSWYYARKVSYEHIPVSWRGLWNSGGSMMKLGVILSLTGLVGMGSMYILRVWIGREIGVEYVGYYNAVFMIIEGYVAMVFSAMSTDFFPRLSQIQSDNTACRKLINEQAEVSLIVITPLLMVLAGFSDLIITILYTRSFIPAVPVLRFAALGVLFKAFAFPFGYMYIAKADKKVFLIKEILSWSYIVILSIFMYYFFGATGLGLGYALGYLFTTIQTLILNKYLYRIVPEVKAIVLFLLSISLLLSICLIQFIESSLLRNIFSACLIIISILYSLYEFNKRMNIKQLLSKLRNR